MIFLFFELDLELRKFSRFEFAFHKNQMKMKIADGPDGATAFEIIKSFNGKQNSHFFLLLRPLRANVPGYAVSRVLELRVPWGTAGFPRAHSEKARIPSPGLTRPTALN